MSVPPRGRGRERSRGHRGRGNQQNWRSNSSGSGDNEGRTNYGSRNENFGRPNRRNDHYNSRNGNNPDGTGDNDGRRNQQATNARRIDNGNGYQQQRRFHIGFKFLSDLAEMECEELLPRIVSKKSAILEFLSTELINPDIFALIIKIVAKICDSNFTESINHVLIEISNSGFIKNLQEYLLKIPLQNSFAKRQNTFFWNDPKQFLDNLVKFLETITKLSPTTSYDKCRSLLMVIKTLLLELITDEAQVNEINERLNRISQKFKDLETKEKRVLSERCGPKDKAGPPPDDFRKLPILPTRDDLIYMPQFVRENLVDGAYTSVDHYLDVQFRLMREDCFGPIRDGIQQFRRNPERKRFDNIRVYQDAVFMEPYVGHEHIGYLVKFMAVKEKENKGKRRYTKEFWMHSKRFLFGSLVVFTKPDMMETMMATVIDRDVGLLEHGCIAVACSSVGGVLPSPKIGTPYIMIESEVYFEPYHHVLKALQDPDFGDHLAMADYIVDVKVDVKTPSYLTEETKFSINNNTFNILDKNTWPSRDVFGLDETQYVAFMSGLTKEFSVIQGPPGTGKTYLAVKIVKTIIDNFYFNADELISEVNIGDHDLQRVNELIDLMDNATLNANTIKGAILVICYTNHALDQFLEEIIKFTKNIVRIGGQSKNEVVNAYNINKMRAKRNGDAASAYNETRINLNDAVRKIEKVKADLTTLDVEILSFAELSKHVDCQNIPHDYAYRKKSYDDPIIKFLFSRAAHLVDRDNMPDINSDVIVDDESLEIRCGVNLDEDVKKKRKPGEVIKSNFETCFSPTEVLIKLRLLNDQMEANRNANIASYDLYNEYMELYELFARYKAFMEYKYDPQLRRQHPYEPFDRYFEYIETIKRIAKRKTYELNLERERCYARYEEARMMMDFQILKSVDIIGITTTGAARLQKLLRALAPPIVVVEEAAEVLESHIVIALTNKCKHLIMIGDHKQLRPSSSYYKLAKHYNIEISLFERMIKNGILCNTLGVQHRMRPEIASLIVPSIYPVLENHSSVQEYPKVSGMVKNLYFFTHQHREESIDDSNGRKNVFEAKMALRLANYLAQQGYESHEITILATYSGQMFEMRKARKNFVHLNDVRITVVDNYQGEESKIIILSLVRNNEEGRNGFLETENRVCVALSRAREGMYVLGNMDQLKEKSQLWGKINDRLVELKAIGSEIELQCMNHPDVFTKVTEPGSFKKVPEGGCMRQCNMRMPCSHDCTLMCHSYDRNHVKVTCRERCMRKLCELNHSCPQLCYEECPRCPVMLEKLMPKCGHIQRMACHLDPAEVRCLTNVTVVLPHCKHQAEKLCYVAPEVAICPERCITRLPCGHACIKSCHVRDDPEHEAYKCTKTCDRQRKQCSMNFEDGVVPDEHVCKNRCYEDCAECTTKIKKSRKNCTHTAIVECRFDIEKEPCKKKCKRLIPECGHHCKLQCHQKCGGCNESVDKVVADCGHTVKIRCMKTPNRTDCLAACERILPCGHKCNLKCRDDCQSAECKTLVPHSLKTSCGHQFKIPCHLAQNGCNLKPWDISSYCSEPCGVELSCEHYCSGTCGSCRNYRIHVLCTQNCEKSLLCGHRCKEPCNTECPPCKTNCGVRCVHNECRKLCGQPCIPCKEQCIIPGCNRRCGAECAQEMPRVRCEKQMPCGHQCQSLEGLICPNLCAICKPEELPTDFLTFEDYTEDNIFVKLEDCPHSFEIEAMDLFMSGDKEIIQIRQCPLCNAPIINSLLYRNAVRNTFVKEIDPIKRKIYGDPKEIANEKLLIAEKVKRTSQVLLQSLIKSDPSLEKVVSKILTKIETTLKDKSIFLNKLKALNVCLKILDKLILKFNEFDEIRKRVQVTDPEAIIVLMKFILPSILNTNFKTPVQFQIDINLELRRLNLLVEFYKIETTEQYREGKHTPIVADAAKTALEAVLVPERFTNEIKTNNENEVYNAPGPSGVTNTILSAARSFFGNTSNEKSDGINAVQTPESRAILALGNLQKATKQAVTVTAEERRQIVAAIGLRQGHWYKCPNGHFYCIADCGGAMVISKCIECGASIGGQNHALLPGNRHAGEIDGSAHPAWSDAANMRNYQL